MEKIYSLLVFVRGRTPPFHFAVDKDDYDRLSRILDSADNPVDPGFFWCHTTDGRSVIINLDAVQTVRFLWDIWQPPDVAERCDDPIQIYLRGREKPIDTGTGSPGSIHDFFSQLELDRRMSPFPSFIDSDGEYLYVNASEVDLVIAPKNLMAEGAHIAQEEFQENTTSSKSD
jgi:hypothetical protein